MSLYLSSGQITKPGKVYDVKFPECFKDCLPPRPKVLCDTARWIHLTRAGLKVKSVSKTWLIHMTHYKENGFLRYLRAADACIASYHRDQRGLPGTKYKFKEMTMLDDLCERLAYECLTKQFEFEGWVEEVGKTVALERLRMRKPNQADEKFHFFGQGS
jgi:hypothetical protein